MPDPEGYKGVQHLGNKEVLLTDETGGKKVVNAAENTSKNTPKNTPKKPKKRNMNEEATNYYSSMLQIQEKLAKERMKVYKPQQDLLKELQPVLLAVQEERMRDCHSPH